MFGLFVVGLLVLVFGCLLVLFVFGVGLLVFVFGCGVVFVGGLVLVCGFCLVVWVGCGCFVVGLWFGLCFGWVVCLGWVGVCGLVVVFVFCLVLVCCLLWWLVWWVFCWVGGLVLVVGGWFGVEGGFGWLVGWLAPRLYAQKKHRVGNVITNKEGTTTTTNNRI